MASRTGLSADRASANAASPHGRQAISPARFGRGEKWNSAIDLVQLDLVAERIEDVAARPSGDLRRGFRAHASRFEVPAHPADVVDLQGEVPAWMKGQIVLDRQVDVGAAGHLEPETRPVPERGRPRDLPQAELAGVERPGAGLLARRIEHLGVMEPQN